MINRLISLLILVTLSPFLILVAIIIVIEDGMPFIFKQKRIGINNSNFLLYKFRTMKKSTPDIPTHLLKRDSNLFTLVGPLLRKLSIDELPQLINILKGEMTFIGPRPALYNQDDLIESRMKAGVDKLMPGITGWAQINGRDKLSIQEKVAMDNFYLLNQSLFLDIKILYITILKVFKSEGVSS